MSHNDITTEDGTSNIELQLKRMQPTPLESDFLAQLTGAMTVASKLSSPKLSFSSDFASTRSSRPWYKFKRYAVAASIALLGGASALLMSNDNFSHNDSTTLVKNAASPTRQTSNIASDSVTSYGNNQAVQVSGETWENAGKTVWLNENSPHKYIKVNYMKTVQGVDKDGNQVQMSIPAQKYVLVPDEAY